MMVGFVQEAAAVMLASPLAPPQGLEAPPPPLPPPMFPGNDYADSTDSTCIREDAFRAQVCSVRKQPL